MKQKQKHNKYINNNNVREIAKLSRNIQVLIRMYICIIVEKTEISVKNQKHKIMYRYIYVIEAKPRRVRVKIKIYFLMLYIHFCVFGVTHKSLKNNKLHAINLRSVL